MVASGRHRAAARAVAALGLVALLAGCASSAPDGDSRAAPATAGAATGARGGGVVGATGRPVSIPGSEIRTLRSTATGTTYELYIGYPDGWTPGSGTRYPVVYFPDAQWDFKVVRAIYENEVYDGTVPPMILVGITYPGVNPDYLTLRAHDLTPVVEADVPGSGGAPAFLTFLTSQVVPYVEQSLGGDPRRRYLLGNSYGGLFTLHAMYQDPAFFAGYVSSSPVVTFGDRALERADAAYAASRKPLATRLFVTVGTTERLHVPVMTFLATLTGRGYQGLHLGTRELDGEGHAGGKAEAYSRGLRYLFASS